MVDRSGLPLHANAETPRADSLRRELAALQTAAERLGTALTAATRDLREDGVCPSQTLVQELEEYRRAFEGLRTQLPAAPTRERLSESLADLEREVADYDVWSQAQAMLADLQSLEHTEDRQHPAVQRCRGECQRLQAVLAEQGPAGATEARAMIHEQHPLRALRSLVLNGDELTDDQWSALHEIVGTAFGKELAVAIARGKLSTTAASKKVDP